MNPLATGLVLCSSYGQNFIEVIHPLPVSQLEGLTTSTAWGPPCTPFPGLTRGLVTLCNTLTYTQTTTRATAAHPR